MALHFRSMIRRLGEADGNNPSNHFPTVMNGARQKALLESNYHVYACPRSAASLKRRCRALTRTVQASSQHCSGPNRSLLALVLVPVLPLGPELCPKTGREPGNASLDQPCRPERFQRRAKRKTGPLGSCRTRCEWCVAQTHVPQGCRTVREKAGSPLSYPKNCAAVFRIAQDTPRFFPRPSFFIAEQSLCTAEGKHRTPVTLA